MHTVAKSFSIAILLSLTMLPSWVKAEETEPLADPPTPTTLTLRTKPLLFVPLFWNLGFERNMSDHWTTEAHIGLAYTSLNHWQREFLEEIPEIREYAAKHLYLYHVGVGQQYYFSGVTRNSFYLGVSLDFRNGFLTADDDSQIPLEDFAIGIYGGYRLFIAEKWSIKLGGLVYLNTNNRVGFGLEIPIEWHGKRL